MTDLEKCMKTLNVKSHIYCDKNGAKLLIGSCVKMSDGLKGIIITGDPETQEIIVKTSLTKRVETDGILVSRADGCNQDLLTGGRRTRKQKKRKNLSRRQRRHTS